MNMHCRRVKRVALRLQRARREAAEYEAAIRAKVRADVEKGAALSVVAEMLRGLDENQLKAVQAFAFHLRFGGVLPLFFSQIADALEGREAGGLDEEAARHVRKSVLGLSR